MLEKEIHNLNINYTKERKVDMHITLTQRHIYLSKLAHITMLYSGTSNLFEPIPICHRRNLTN
jgi:hypothetical protein